MFIALLAVSGVFADEWPPGTTIDEAAAAVLTPEAFDQVETLLPSLLPSEIEIPDFSQDGGFYEFSLTNAWATVNVDDVRVIPRMDVIDIEADLTVQVNDSSDPFDLYYYLLFGGETCAGHVDPFNVTVTTRVAMDVISTPDGNRLDATVGDIDVAYALDGSAIHMAGCTIGDIEEVLGYFGLSIYDLLISQLDSVLTDAVADVGPTIEATIEDAFASANIEQSLDVNGIPVNIHLYPNDVVIRPEGVQLILAGAVDTPSAAECISAFDPGGSLKTESALPDIGELPSGVSPYHVALDLSDDFANQAIYSLWRGGLLCYTLAEGGPVPLDGSILNALADDAFTGILDEGAPLVLRTVPREAPVVDYTGPNDIDLQLSGLGLEFYSSVDGRLTRVINVDIEGNVGANLNLDADSGQMAVELDIDPENLIPDVTYNELAPDANSAIEGAFGGLVGSLLGSVLGGLTDSLAFAIPSFSGLGLTNLQVTATGDDRDWLGAYATLGAVDYGSADGGCGTDGGCSGGGCAVGGGMPAAAGVISGLSVLLASRRRRA